MDEEQEMEWKEAQRTVVSVDLVAAAKQQIQFLKVIDRNRWLYEGPGLQKAIHRYNGCWLPLLAAHGEYPLSKGPLVVPLDCEWIWHCHRLNPVRYKSDCEEIYGKVIDNHNVGSSVQGLSKTETEEIWNRLYPDEPYELDMAEACSAAPPEKPPHNFVTYDLASAVARQSPFVYQVSRAHMNIDLFLQEAFSRYKGFLHLKRRNEERCITQFNVPTYDIDLMWHSHILHPVRYNSDTTRTIGKILEHVEDADRTIGRRLDIGFSETTKQWEETFGTRYSKAGAMFRGLPPTPVTNFPYKPDVKRNRVISFAESLDMDQLIGPIPEKEIVEMYIQIIGVRNLPDDLAADSLSVYVSKEKADAFFTSRRKLSIMSLSGKNHISSFQCEPSGKLLIELASQTKPSPLHFSMVDRRTGTFLLPLSEFLPPVYKLSFEKWFELSSTSDRAGLKPLSLRVAVSFTIPTRAPTILLLVPSKPASKKFCFFPFLVRTSNSRAVTRVQDVMGTQIVSLQMRMVQGYLAVEGATKQGLQTFAKRVKGVWFIEQCSWTLRKASSSDNFVFEFKGNKMVRLYQGRKLEYESKCCSRDSDRETDFLTAIEFSREHPYGKAVAVLNWRSGYLVVGEPWFVQYGIILAYILSEVMKVDAAREEHQTAPSSSTDTLCVNQETNNSEEHNAEHKQKGFETKNGIGRGKESQAVRVVPLVLNGSACRV